METRIQKHLKYRSELIKEGATTIDTKSNPRRRETLPLKAVMEDGDDPSRYYYLKQRKHRILMYILLGVILAGILTGLIIFGIFAFRG